MPFYIVQCSTERLVLKFVFILEYLLNAEEDRHQQSPKS